MRALLLLVAAAALAAAGARANVYDGVRTASTFYVRGPAIDSRDAVHLQPEVTLITPVQQPYDERVGGMVTFVDLSTNADARFVGNFMGVGNITSYVMFGWDGLLLLNSTAWTFLQTTPLTRIGFTRVSTFNGVQTVGLPNLAAVLPLAQVLLAQSFLFAWDGGPFSRSVLVLYDPGEALPPSFVAQWGVRALATCNATADADGTMWCGAFRPFTARRCAGDGVSDIAELLGGTRLLTESNGSAGCDPILRHRVLLYDATTRTLYADTSCAIDSQSAIFMWSGLVLLCLAGNSMTTVSTTAIGTRGWYAFGVVTTLLLAAAHWVSYLYACTWTSIALALGADTDPAGVMYTNLALVSALSVAYIVLMWRVARDRVAPNATRRVASGVYYSWTRIALMRQHAYVLSTFAALKVQLYPLLFPLVMDITLIAQVIRVTAADERVHVGSAAAVGALWLVYVTATIVYPFMSALLPGALLSTVWLATLFVVIFYTQQ